MKKINKIKNKKEINKKIEINKINVIFVLAAMLIFVYAAYAASLNVIIPIKNCSAEDNALKGSFGGACDFPNGSALQSNGGNVETHTANRVGQTSYYGGVKTVNYNDSITNCSAIVSVSICYEWWVDAGIADCDVSVDANGGSSFTAVTTTCPGTTANPGVVCTNVTSLEGWTCSNFFSSSGTRAQAKSEARRGGGAGTTTITWDVLYFNVTYFVDDVPPTVVNVSSNPQSVYQNQQTNISATITDNSTIKNVTYEVRYPNSTKINYTLSPLFSDEFNDGILSAKWRWYNKPASWDEGSTLAGYLRLTSDPNTDFWDTDNSGNFLFQNVSGDFEVIAKINATPSVSYQKVGIMVRQDRENWINIMKEYDTAVQISTDIDVNGVSSDVATTSFTANPYWLKINRTGNTFRTYYSSDGSTWVSHYNYTPTVSYPNTVEVGLAIASGTTPTQITGYYDYVRLVGQQQYNGDVYGNNYTLFFNDTSQVGIYNVTIIASDVYNNINNTEKTWFNVTAITPYLTTNSSSYQACNIVFYKISVFDQNDQPLDSSLDISIIDPSNTTVQQNTTSTGNGGTGVYIGEYILNATAQIGDWTIKALAGIVKGTKIFGVG